MFFQYHWELHKDAELPCCFAGDFPFIAEHWREGIVHEVHDWFTELPVARGEWKSTIVTIHPASLWFVVAHTLRESLETDLVRGLAGVMGASQTHISTQLRGLTSRYQHWLSEVLLELIELSIFNYLFLLLWGKGGDEWFEGNDFMEVGCFGAHIVLNKGD